MVTANSQRGTILVVDDHSAVLDLVTRVLEKHGFEVVATVSPAEALNISARHPGDIHLLLSDILMHEMSGLELAHQITTLRPHMRVIFMSGYADGTVVPLDRGWHFIKKPFFPSTLVAYVNHALLEKA